MARRFSSAAAIILCLAAISAATTVSAAPAFNERNGVLFFEGEGRADPSIANDTQRKSLAKEAAILDAKAKVAAYVHALKDKRGMPLAEAAEKDDTTRSRIRVFLKGVGAGRARWDQGLNCNVTLKVNKRALLKRLNAEE